MRYCLVSLAIALIVGSGLVQGYLSDRWQPHRQVADAVARVARLPLTMGAWHGTPLSPRDPGELKDVAAHFYARFVNDRDSSSVSVLLVAGLPGPVSIHVPTDCYLANGFDVGEPVPLLLDQMPGAPGGEFMTAALSRAGPAGSKSLRIYWAWTADGCWKAPETPRWTFAAAPVLYKLYLLPESPNGNRQSADIACKTFMRSLLPELHRTLFSS